MNPAMFLPFAYGFCTRVPTAFDKLSFCCLWLLPLWFACRAPLPPFLLAAGAQYALYELGYLQNDFWTVRRERQPHYRLPSKERARLKPGLLALSRALWAAVFLLLLFVLPLGVPLHWLRFLLALLVLCLFFLAHNLVRSRWNMLTYFLLCSAKYAALPALFLPASQGCAVWLAFFACFVLPRSLEHCAKPKYRTFLCGRLRPARFRAAWDFFAALSGAFFLPDFPQYSLFLWYYAFRTGCLAAAETWGDPRKKIDEAGAQW